MNKSGFSTLLGNLKVSLKQDGISELSANEEGSACSKPQSASTPETIEASSSLAGEAATKSPFSALHTDTKLWDELGTRLWRAERQVHRLHQSEASENSERLLRRFEEIIETLHDHDIEILDHTGERYDTGLALKVLQYEPQGGITEEVVLETVKPSVRVKGVLLPGEVIVASPRQSNDTSPERARRAENEIPQRDHNES